MTGSDQAQLPIFRGLLVVQVAAGLVFGLFPLLLPGTFAALFGYSGDDPLVYRLAGASTFGYAVSAGLAFAWRSGWAAVRVPMVATFTFNVTAVVASLGAIAYGDRSSLPIVVLVAAGLFTVLSGYWLIRDEGDRVSDGPELGTPFRAVIGLATLSAAVFGVLPLVVPGTFATLFGLTGTDAYIFRLAGAATLGYANAGLLELRATSYGPIRIQNLAAIAFNALGAVVSILALVSGEGGLLAPVVAVAATFFAIALTWFDRRQARAGMA